MKKCTKYVCQTVYNFSFLRFCLHTLFHSLSLSLTYYSLLYLSLSQSSVSLVPLSISFLFLCNKKDAILHIILCQTAVFICFQNPSPYSFPLPCLKGNSPSPVSKGISPPSSHREFPYPFSIQ